MYYYYYYCEKLFPTLQPNVGKNRREIMNIGDCWWGTCLGQGTNTREVEGGERKN